MKNLILTAFLVITASISATFASAEEWTLKASGFKEKGGALVEIIDTPKKFMISATLNGTHLIINFSDGKQKFGSSVIKIQSGENVYGRPRLMLSVPIEDVKKVKRGNPVLVSSFSYEDKPFKMNLVHSGGAIPNIVITSK